jgi:hypothetical protein
VCVASASVHCRFRENLPIDNVSLCALNTQIAIISYWKSLLYHYFISKIKKSHYRYCENCITFFPMATAVAIFFIEYFLTFLATLPFHFKKKLQKFKIFFYSKVKLFFKKLFYVIIFHNHLHHK